MKIDLHIHSKYSADSLSELEDVIKKSKEKGLNAIAITDHETLEGAIRAKKIASKKNKDLIVIIGQEHKTDKGDIIGLFLKRKVKSIKYNEAVKEIRKQGGLVLLPHPKKELECDLIEGYNARKGKGLKFITRKKKVSCSDAHFVSEVGRSYITVHGVKKEEDIKKALINSRITSFNSKSSKLLLMLAFFIALFKKSSFSSS